jgi:CRP/FNR family transcriptional regulator, cyclic AMP receptor protein
LSAQHARRVSLLEAAPELGANLSDRTRTLAERAFEVDVIALDPGPWEPSREDPGSGHLGILVLDGLMTRELTVAGARSLELLNNGDLLRPWEEEAASFVEARWVALQPVRLAVLDRQLAARLGRFPDLVEALIGCAMHRSRTLAVHSAIENMPRLEDRLLLLFWQMAQRWGTRRGGRCAHADPPHPPDAGRSGRRATTLRVDGARQAPRRRLAGERPERGLAASRGGAGSPPPTPAARPRAVALR